MSTPAPSPPAAGLRAAVAGAPDRDARRLDGIACLILLVVGGFALATFRDYGLGWDDFTHAQMGEKWLALYGSGFQDRSAFSFVNLYMYGGGFDMLAALAAKVLPLSLFDTRRLVGAAVGIVGLAVTWRLGRRLGGPGAGVVALAVLATCPIFYGHMFFNAKDAPFAVAMAVLLLGAVRALQEYPRPSWGSVGLVGLGLGLTFGTRIVGVIAALYVALALVLLLAAEWRSLGLRAAARRFAGWALRLAPSLALGYVLMGLLWPWSVAAPLNPLRALEYFSVFFEKPWREVFAGQLIWVPDMPASYLPTLLGLQLPEIMLALMLAGAGLATVRAARRAFPIGERAAYALMVAAALLPVAVVVITRPAMYNGFRHFLFILPPMAVLAGLAGASLWAWAQRQGRTARYAVAAAAVVGFASPVVEMVRLHPYEYTHFNRIEGGVAAAENQFMLDYWGLSLKQAAQQLKAHLAKTGERAPAGRRWRVAVCGPHPPAQVALGPEFDLTWDPHDADFALMLGTYYCAQFPAPRIATVEREGVVYARGYDIREQHYSTLLTVPPP